MCLCLRIGRTHVCCPYITGRSTDSLTDWPTTAAGDVGAYDCILHRKSDSPPFVFLTDRYIHVGPRANARQTVRCTFPANLKRRCPPNCKCMMKGPLHITPSHLQPPPPPATTRKRNHSSHQVIKYSVPMHRATPTMQSATGQTNTPTSKYCRPAPPSPTKYKLPQAGRGLYSALAHLVLTEQASQLLDGLRALPSTTGASAIARVFDWLIPGHGAVVAAEIPVLLADELETQRARGVTMTARRIVREALVRVIVLNFRNQRGWEPIDCPSATENEERRAVTIPRTPNPNMK